MCAGHRAIDEQQAALRVVHALGIVASNNRGLEAPPPACKASQDRVRTFWAWSTTWECSDYQREMRPRSPACSRALVHLQFDALETSFGSHTPCSPVKVAKTEQGQLWHLKYPWTYPDLIQDKTSCHSAEMLTKNQPGEHKTRHQPARHEPAPNKPGSSITTDLVHYSHNACVLPAGKHLQLHGSGSTVR
jgi:hypothetical protein